MSALGEINRKTYILKRTLDETDTYPFDLQGDSIIGISISNNDPTNSITIDITDEDDTVISIRVAATKNFISLVEKLKTVNTSAVGSFDIALFREG